MRKLMMIVAVLLGALLVMGTHGGGSPMDGMGDHPAKYGLCTAYFAGEGGDNGNRNDAPPFQALEDAAVADDDSETVAEYCEGTQPGNSHGEGGDSNNAPDPAEDRGNGQG